MSTARSPLRAVAVPSEHGGWGLTAEPVLLGLIVAPSAAGACLGAAAFLAFLARTPLKVVLVDRHRGRVLDRTRLAARVLALEVVVLVALGATALARTAPGAWWPLAIMGPLVSVELWFDMRSRSRRLVPELAGAVGIAGVAALILLAGGRSGAVAAGAWLILAARSIAAIVAVRDQVAVLHGRASAPGQVLAAELVAAAIAAAAAWRVPEVVAGAIAVVVAIGAQRLLALAPPARAVILGIRQSAIGVAVVVVTALGMVLGN